MTIQALKLLLLSLSLSSSTIQTIYSNTSNISNQYIESGFDSSSSITPIKGAELICDNLTKFENYYNEIFPNSDKLIATSIENFIPLFIECEGSQIEGILIDLNDANGYITIGYDYEILDIQGKGNQPFYDYPGYKYFFSVTNGYSYYDSQIDEWLSVYQDNNSEEKDWNNIELNSRTYDGQLKDQTGNGKIFDTNKYVYDKYGYGYGLNRSASLSMDGFSQDELSVYYSIGTDNIEKTEGNCWIVSAFNVLQYLATVNLTNMYFSKNDKVDYNAKKEEPNIYSKHFDSNDRSKETVKIKSTDEIKDKWKLSNNKFPKLYYDVRNFVEKTYKKCDGGYVWETANIVKQIANQYNYNISYKNCYRWGAYVDKVKNKIDLGIPCIWSTSNDTYGAHSMAVCGYKYYKKTTKFWFFTYSTYKLFFELRDGHSKDDRYFDVSGHIGFSCLTFFNL